MKNVMTRAWEIYRGLIGDKTAKLSMALKQAWSEIKKGAKKVMATAQEIKALNTKAVLEKDWNKRGELVKEGLKMSAEYMKSKGFLPKPELLDDVVKTILENRGNGWFSEQWSVMIVAPRDQKEANSYLTSWAKAYQAIKAGK